MSTGAAHPHRPEAARPGRPGGPAEPVRPGPLPWRILLVLGAAILIWLTVDAVADAVFGPRYGRARHAFAAVAVPALVVPLVLLARRWLDRRPMAGLGLGRPTLLPVGAAVWLVPAGLGAAALVALGRVEITPRTTPAEALRTAALLLVLVLLYEALPEELLFRGYLYRRLVARLPVWAAIVGQAALFAAFGVLIGAAGSVDRIVVFFGFSIVLGMLRAATGTVWVCVGFHLAFQTVAQLTGDVGGQFDVRGLTALHGFAFGLLPALVAALAFVRRVDWRRTEPDPPATASPDPPAPPAG